MSDNKLRRPGEWLKHLETSTPEIIQCLSQIYGNDDDRVERKRQMLISMLTLYLFNFNNEPVLISRAPGRINLMGRHVDHQGGNGNVMAIGDDIYCIIGSRNDRWIHLRNIDSNRFLSNKFLIDDLITAYKGIWLSFVNSDVIHEQVIASQGDWSQYVKAAVARFQTKFLNQPLKGMNILVAGDIPIAAGLSSSSALFVAISEGIVEINKLQLLPQQFIELCAEGEWYVGTRGGAGDHAAMKYCRKGKISKLNYYPIRLIDSIEFPANYLVVVCDSKVKARKTEEAKETFNHRVACYHIGRELIKLEFPQYASRIKHICDINTENLSIDYPALLKMIKKLPVSITQQKVINLLSPEVEKTFLSARSNLYNKFPIRSVVMFGLAEIERSQNTLNLLKTGQIDEFGHWMNISHNGDRVVNNRYGENKIPYCNDYSDATMDRLIVEEENSHDKASLVFQPGSYGCSIPEIDQMVDIALSVKGVKGAQISGAGLGGCIMALVDKKDFQKLEEALIQYYYNPAKIEPGIFCYKPTAGSGLVCL